jgi:hypothetical protein
LNPDCRVSTPPFALLQHCHQLPGSDVFTEKLFLPKNHNKNEEK